MFRINSRGKWQQRRRRRQKRLVKPTTRRGEKQRAVYIYFFTSSVTVRFVKLYDMHLGTKISHSYRKIAELHGIMLPFYKIPISNRVKKEGNKVNKGDLLYMVTRPARHMSFKVNGMKGSAHIPDCRYVQTVQ